MKIPTPKDFEVFKLKREQREDREVHKRANVVLKSVCRNLKLGYLETEVYLGRYDREKTVKIVRDELMKAGWHVNIHISRYEDKIFLSHTQESE